VIVPCFRGGGHVGRVVEGALSHVSEVLVVDDGSDDGSGEEARRAGARLFVRERNGGKGAALRDGIGFWLGEPGITHVLFMDADGQHTADDMPRFLEAARQGAPFVIGSRFAEREKIPAKRYWANYIGSRVLSRMTGQEIFDTQSGYRMISTRVLRRLLPDLRSTGYAIESEILIKAAALGVPVSHVPVRTIYDGNPSHYRPFADTWCISWLCVGFKVFDCD
jgi:glycosyltransferase involved in cell wall biosynthesis